MSVASQGRLAPMLELREYTWIGERQRPSGVRSSVRSLRWRRMQRKKSELVRSGKTGSQKMHLRSHRSKNDAVQVNKQR